MNWLIIAGIILLGVGALLISPLVQSEWSIVFGVILQVISYFAIRKGESDSSERTVKNSEKNVISEISKFRKELQLAKSTGKSEKEIKSIENRFKNWAKDFNSKKNLKVIGLNKEKLKEREHEENLNQEWNGTYRSIFSILENLISAYKNQKNTSISTIEFPKFPLNIISQEAAHYFCKVKFVNGKYLYVALVVISTYGKNKIPDITFQINTDDKKIGKQLYAGEFSMPSDVRISFNLDEETVEVYKYKGSLHDGDREKYELTKSYSEWEKIVTDIVEYLLAKVEVSY